MLQLFGPKTCEGEEEKAADRRRKRLEREHARGDAEKEMDATEKKAVG
jgi:hypothetical protein